MVFSYCSYETTMTLSEAFRILEAPVLKFHQVYDQNSHILMYKLKYLQQYYRKQQISNLLKN